MHVGQSVVTAAVAESKAIVIHTELVQNRGVDVVDVSKWVDFHELFG